MPELNEGSVVDGRYKVLRKIGTGGMADVWLAEDAHLQRQVALKVLHTRFAQDREFVERFRREAESAAGLNHPNIVSVYDRGDVEGTYYIAMQYLQGRSLKELIDVGLTPEQSVYLIRQVLEGARFAHKNGVVHRDLKPQNVIVDDEGKAVVTDFGIARAGVSEITQTGSVMGTPHYLSPEQAQGEEVTPVSDLYSVGVMLYEALAGRVPFEGESAVAVAMKQVSQAPQLPSSIKAGISPALDAVVIRALQKSPGDRFQTADAFIAALDNALKAGDEAGGGTAVFAPLPAAIMVDEAEVAEMDELEREERRRRRLLWTAAAVAALIVALLVWNFTRDTSTDVPNVTGNQLNTAIALLQQDGFDVGEVNRVQRQTAANQVLEQDPSPGDTSLSCAFLNFFCSKPKVDLTVSAGPGNAKVPSTAGLEQEAAMKRVEEAGFQAQVSRVNSEDVDEGLVVKSSPSGGSTTTRGSTVTLVVSSGPKLIRVPVLVGTQRSVAVQQISSRGLEPAIREEESSDPEGQVIEQVPDAGSEITRGSQVTITVSGGEEQASVPNVIGKLRPDAVAAIREAGLDPVVSEQITDVPSKVGKVTDQFPPPGTEAEPGTEVKIVVGKAAPGGTAEEVEEE
ncbi:MAG TPA: Stk1 family PASTA domain-containing Ser/Thr kinase [Solirubrobacterales bacterium]